MIIAYIAKKLSKNCNWWSVRRTSWTMYFGSVLSNDINIDFVVKYRMFAAGKL